MYHEYSRCGTGLLYPQFPRRAQTSRTDIRFFPLQVGGKEHRFLRHRRQDRHRVQRNDSHAAGHSLGPPFRFSNLNQ